MVTSFMAQTAAVGTISMVLMFPSPDDLRSALTVEPAYIAVVSEDSSALLIDIPTTYDGVRPVVKAPVSFKECAEAATNMKVLDNCGIQLARFIRDVRDAPVAVGSNRFVTHPEIEKARVALIEICRVRWALAPTEGPDNYLDGACRAMH